MASVAVILSGVVVKYANTWYVAVAAARAHRDSVGPLKVLDMCGGSGLRALRYSVEVPDTRVVISDVSEEACNLISENLMLNDIDSDRVEIFHGDGRIAALKDIRSFDVIDIVERHPTGALTDLPGNAFRS